jgi:hypothetical protein
LLIAGPISTGLNLMLLCHHWELEFLHWKSRRTAEGLVGSELGKDEACYAPG